jgi:hypothetical protein
MTLQELYKEVSQLGFEDSLGDDGNSRFIYATNRALIEVNSLRPRSRRAEILHRVPANLLFSDPKVIEKTETMIFTARGAKSFSFEVLGKGSFTVGIKREDKNTEGKVEEDTIEIKKGEFDDAFKFVSHKGFIRHNEAFIDKLMKSNKKDEYPRYTGDVEIIFDGDYDYTIRNLAMYDKVYSDDESTIVPYGTEIGYNLKDFTDDFETVSSPPIDERGNYLHEDYRIEGATVYLPANKPGVYTINYLHKVRLIPNGSDVSGASGTPIEIDLEDDLASLLPNLIASYVWLDDETDKSQYYYNLYLQRAERIRSEARDLNPIEFTSVNGW